MVMPFSGVNKANLEMNLRTKYDPSGDANCVLWLPFYDWDLRTSPVSKDNSQVACTVTGATWGDFKASRGYTTDGTNDLLSVPDSDAWDFGTGAFTISMWLKNTTDDDGNIIDHGGYGNVTSDAVGWSLVYNGTQFVWRYYHTPGTTLIDDMSFAHNFGSGYHHVTLIRDAASDIRMLVDGAQIGTTQASTANITLSALALRMSVAYSDAEAGWLAATWGSCLILKGKGWTDAENYNDYMGSRWRFQ